MSAENIDLSSPPWAGGGATDGGLIDQLSVAPTLMDSLRRGFWQFAKHTYSASDSDESYSPDGLRSFQLMTSHNMNITSCRQCDGELSCCDIGTLHSSHQLSTPLYYGSESHLDITTRSYSGPEAGGYVMIELSSTIHHQLLLHI